MNKRFELFTKGITSIYRSVQKIKNIEMTEFGLKGMHVLCLFFLRQNPNGLTAVKLCELCAEDKAAISRTIATLKERGYVDESQPDDNKKYRSVIRLTAEGEKIATAEENKIANAVTAGGEGLTDEQREAFYQSLVMISQNLENYILDLEG